MRRHGWPGTCILISVVLKCQIWSEQSQSQRVSMCELKRGSTCQKYGVSPHFMPLVPQLHVSKRSSVVPRVWCREMARYLKTIRHGCRAISGSAQNGQTLLWTPSDILRKDSGVVRFHQFHVRKKRCKRLALVPERPAVPCDVISLFYPNSKPQFVRRRKD